MLPLLGKAPVQIANTNGRTGKDFSESQDPVFIGVGEMWKMVRLHTKVSGTDKVENEDGVYKYAWSFVYFLIDMGSYGVVHKTKPKS